MNNIDSDCSWPEVQANLPNLEGRKVAVVPECGDEMEGHVRALKADTLRLSSSDTTKWSDISYQDIHKITVFNNDNYAVILAGVIAGGLVGAKIGYDNDHGGMIHLPEIASAGGGVVGAIVGAGIASIFFHVRDTYVFRGSPSETLLVRVEKLIEDGVTEIKVRIGQRKYVLPKSECGVIRLPGGVYVKGPRAMFIKFGVPVH